MNDCGIYRIRNLVTGDFYLGQSKNLSERRTQHFRGLRSGKGANKHLQSAYNKYGRDNFVFEIALYCEPDELTYYEQSLVTKLNPAYNIRKECVDSNKGVSVSNNTRRLHRDKWLNKLIARYYEKDRNISLKLFLEQESFNGFHKFW